MLLVLYRARAHGDVAKHIDEVLVVGGVEHLVGGEHASFLRHAQVHAADGLDAAQKIARALGVGVVQEPLVARALGARLVGVDARYDEEALAYALGKLRQAAGVFEHGVLAVGGARADDDELAVVLARENVGNLCVERRLLRRGLGRKRHLLADLLGDGQQALKLHGHIDP